MTWTETTDKSTSEWAAHETVSPFSTGRSGLEAASETAEAEADEAPYGELLGEAGQFETWTTEALESAVTPFAHATIAADREVLAAELMAELAGSGLGEALGELVQEWSGTHAEHATAGGLGETPQAGNEAHQLLLRQAEELATQTEEMLETLAGEWGDREASSITENELQSLFETLETAPIPLGGSPAQEQFFSAIARVARKAVRGAVKLVKRGVSFVGKIVSAPLRALLSRLGKLVRPLLKRVLTWAIRRLPVALRPAADSLRRRLFGSELPGELGEEEFAATPELSAEHGGWTNEASFLAELRDEYSWRSELPAVGEIATLEAEFTNTLARSIAAEDETELAYLEAEFHTTTAETESSPGAAELDAARVTLIRELAALRDGESPGPAIERFLPAVLPILRIGVRLIGRGRVVNFLANLLTGLVRPLIGPQLAGPLSQAVVDTGLRIFGFEMTPEDRELAGPSVVASVLEDTIRRIAEQGESAFEDMNRLHTETIAAFNEAVAHTVPGSLVRADHEDRETAGKDDATWLLRPRVYWYRKYARVFEVALTPQMAASIITFGGLRLSDALRATGPRMPMRVRVHLYETLPGTYLSRISALERHVPGMAPDGWRRFHPLSTSAAGLLLGEPGLGRDVDARFTANRSTVAAGQRFYYLQLPPGRLPDGGVTQAFLTIDGRPSENRVRMMIYLAEGDAQAIAARARANNTTAFVLAMRTAVTAAVNSLRKAPGTRVTVLREAVGVDEAAAAAGSALGMKIVDKIIDRVIDAAIRLGTDYVRHKGAEFVQAVDNPAKGVTVVVTFPAPGLSTILRGGLVPSLMQLGVLRTLLGSLASRGGGVQTFPGLRRF